MSGEDKHPPADGRATRWADHRSTRREQLVLAAVQAIDELGPGASIADMARAAGVSKPVLYRYFADKDDLYRAVGHWGADQVLQALRTAIHSGLGPRATVDRACQDYLKLISRHPQVFLLLVEHPAEADPLRDGRELIAASFSRVLGDLLRSLGMDASAAEPWAHGVVGLGLAQGEWWVRRRTVSRTAAATFLADFVWHAISGLAAANGNPIGGEPILQVIRGDA